MKHRLDVGQPVPSHLTEVVVTEEDRYKFFTELEEQEKQRYAAKRKREYPPIEDYIDGVVKNDQVQIQNYINACLAVKAKYPKP